MSTEKILETALPVSQRSYLARVSSFRTPVLSRYFISTPELEPTSSIAAHAVDRDSEGRTIIEPSRSLGRHISQLPPPAVADATPIQIWEGVVQEVDIATNTMYVVLNAKIGQIPSHAAEINLEWVTEQDKELVRPGAVFYLTLFKRTKRGSIENSQELRFRRRPSWSKSQLRKIERDAQMFRSKLRPARQAQE